MKSPPFSIALDGYVADGPKFQPPPKGPRANFNHHEKVDRLATRSTSGQVLLAIRQGLFATFRDKEGIHVNIFANDCDEDVCLSIFLLRHPELTVTVQNPTINRLVAVEDLLDATGGTYPLSSDGLIMMEIAWIFEPYRRFMKSGTTDPEELIKSFAGVIEDVNSRIMAHITGRGKSIPLELEYERVGGGPGWAMVREIGIHACTSIFSDGIHAFVSIKEAENGRYRYSVGKLSPFVTFDLEKIFKELNKAEGTTRSKDKWGGSNTIGGGPRHSCSKLQPKEVESIINKVLE